ncbi:hypothetical protein [Butyrivibrio sp. INlla14]|uniref:hypothetical protein n=1 Tax=Butyrivibrio sp. INlla14 TaxID=1520808 RepID=UPI00087693F4|nr:hypothetical protein [Butyrivibrio sp. INlla14]SCY44148.1 hypothetical protein SAMN02910371_02293 [Butyrivibrio sp. INlla14]
MGNDIKYDPVTGQPVSEGLDGGQGLDPNMLAGFDPATGQPIQAQPVPPMQPMQMQQSMQQPMQGNPQYTVNVDSATGQPIQMQQPQMQQPVQPGYYVPPVNQQPRYVAPIPQVQHPDDTDPKAKKLVLASAICLALGHIMPGISSYVSALSNSFYDDDISYILGGGGFFLYIAALILMIVLRVKYPKNKGGKIIMIVMIAEIALTLFAVIMLFATCWIFLDTFGCT